MPLPVPQNTRRRLGFLFSIPLAFCLVFFSVELASERTDIHLLEIQNLQSSVNNLQALAKEAESSERGFLLTGEVASLLPLKQADEMLRTQLKFTDSYTKDRPDLKPQLDQIARLVQQRFDEANQVLNTQKGKGFAAALELTKSNKSDSTMNDLRRLTNSLSEQLSKQEDSYLGRQRDLNLWTFLFFAVGTLVMIGVMFWLYNEVLSYLYARDRAQEQLEKFNSDLQAMVDERTLELTEANQELQQFAYVASHDLQEPLRTITSFSQLLSTRYQGKMDDDANEFIGYIVAASRRMTDLINGLLQIVRLRKAGQPVTKISFERLVEDAKVSLQASIRENQATIEYGPLPELLVDRVQFAQVLQNLISNAIKYRREEPPLIRIQARRERSDWIFAVSDNGRGFNQEFSERIFGLFQRLHGRDVEGTGMGLSIARKIVERHGGRIWAESREGIGSTFLYSLPVALEGLRPPVPVPESTAVGSAR